MTISFDKDAIKVPHLIVQLKDQLFALTIDSIQEILTLPRCVPIPNSPDFFRGAINLRGKVVPVMDLRLKLGMSSSNSAAEVMLAMLHEREQDHIKWVMTLEECVLNFKPFSLSRDPHLCAFGKWYYSFINQTNKFQDVLTLFEEPHAKLHAAASEILTLRESSQQSEQEEALDLLSSLKKNELKTLRKLFNELRYQIQASTSEQVVIFKKDELQLGICVDAVSSTEILDPNTFEGIQHIDLSKYELVTHSARNQSGDIVLLLDIDSLLNLAAEE